MKKYVIMAHNPHPKNTHEEHRYYTLFNVIKRRFRRLHHDLIDSGDTPEIVKAWRATLEEVIESNAPSDEFSLIASHELSVLMQRFDRLTRPDDDTRPSGSKRSSRDEKVIKNKSSISVSRKNRIKREDNLCRYCMTRRSTTVDHVIPRILGGSNDDLNLVGACGPCNSAKGGLTPKEAGMLLHLPRRFFDLTPHQKDV